MRIGPVVAADGRGTLLTWQVKESNDEMKTNPRIPNYSTVWQASQKTIKQFRK
jgi:hypothetical protein